MPSKRRSPIDRRPRLAPAALACVLLAAVAAPLSADWLVTVDGGRVETHGPWEERGRVVVFTLPDGQLASLRLSEVDLEASRAATAAAEEEAKRRAEAPPPAPPAKREPVLVLRDGDVPRARAGGETAAGETSQPGDEGAAEGEGSGPGPTGLRVDSWSQGQDPEDGSVVVRGVVENGSDSFATGVTVAVQVYDVNGEPLASTETAGQPAALRPGQRGEFEARFPGVYAIASVQIDTRGTLLDTAASPAAETAAGDFP